MILVISGIALPLALGSLYWMHEYRLSVLQQLRLDQCTGEMALQFKNHLLRIESLNLQITATRLAILEAGITPPARAALQTLLESLAMIERGILMQWKLKSLKWLGRQLECQASGDQTLPVPELPFQTDPPDSIGSKPLRFIGKNRERYRFSIYHLSRHSVAQVEKSYEKSNSWSAFWTGLH